MSKDEIQILLVEDNPGDARLIPELLRESLSVTYRITHIDNVKMLPDYSLKDFDVVLLDLNYDDIGGIKSYQLAARYLSHIPIIVLTGQNDEELGYEVVKRGAQDYLIKGEIDSKNLERAIRYAIERKRSQSNLKRARGKNKKLQNTANLLKQESERLREINRTKDEFISLASHQLRTPATIVKQYLAMLQGNYAGELQELQRDFIGKAYASNEKQLHIVEDILAVARLDGANNVIHMVPTNVNTLAQEAASTVAEQYSTHNQTLDLRLPGEQITGNIDRTQMSMVLENILENASHYSDANSTVVMELSTTKKWIEIAITDEGVGMDDSELGKLFQKFSRIPNEYSVQVGGTGLGLYWALKIVKLHRGRIAVRSKRGVGTTFTIQLPIPDPA